MKDFIFDTETTGKYLFKRPINDPAQPRVIQFAGIFVEDDVIRMRLSCLIETSVAPTEEAIKIHGITPAVLGSCAVPFDSLLALLGSWLDRADNLIAHNLAFDLSLMRVMCHYAGASPLPWENPKHICTMRSATPILRLPTPWGKYKWPTLEEAYKHFVGQPLKRGNHDALEDTLACWEVLKGLREHSAPLTA